MAEEIDCPDLFDNGGDDADLLFGSPDGDDGELSSLFREIARAEPAPTLTLPQLHLPRPNLFEPNMPAAPDPLSASFLSHQDGHTSGSIVVSTLLSDIGTLPPGPTKDAPPDEAGLEADFEKEWESFISNDQLVNSHPDSQDSEAALEAEFEREWELTKSDDQPVNLHPDAQHSHAALEADIEKEWELAASDDQPVDTHIESQRSEADHGDEFISPTRILGFRYANCQSSGTFRVPRRVDQDEMQAEALMQCVTLSRQHTLSDLYSKLELGKIEGKRLSEAIKERLKAPPFSQLVEQPSRGRLETKRDLIRASFQLLVSENWGTTWFGTGCQNVESRTLLWPADSSLLLITFSLLLYRSIESRKSASKKQFRRDSTWSTLSVPPSPPPSSPPQKSPDNPPATPPLTEKGRRLFDPIARNATIAKKRKHAESVMGSADSKQIFELDIPPNAKLIYYIYVRDIIDSSELSDVTIYRHDWIMSHGGFSGLTSSFKTAGLAPVFEIQTASQTKKIESEDDWEQAVLGIYNRRRSGGVVIVDVWV